MNLYLPQGSADALAAWGALGEKLAQTGLGDGQDLTQEHDGECWQYMGSFAEGEIVRHTFRHRVHPATGRRAYVEVTAPLFEQMECC